MWSIWHLYTVTLETVLLLKTLLTLIIHARWNYVLYVSYQLCWVLFSCWVSMQKPRDLASVATQGKSQTRTRIWTVSFFTCNKSVLQKSIIFLKGILKYRKPYADKIDFVILSRIKIFYILCDSADFFFFFVCLFVSYRLFGVKGR